MPRASRDRGQRSGVFNDSVVAVRALQAQDRIERAGAPDDDVHQGTGQLALPLATGPNSRFLFAAIAAFLHERNVATSTLVYPTASVIASIAMPGIPVCIVPWSKQMPAWRFARRGPVPTTTTSSVSLPEARQDWQSETGSCSTLQGKGHPVRNGDVGRLRETGAGRRRHSSAGAAGCQGGSCRAVARATTRASQPLLPVLIACLRRCQRRIYL